MRISLVVKWLMPGTGFDPWSRKTPHTRAPKPVHHSDCSLCDPGPESQNSWASVPLLLTPKHPQAGKRQLPIPRAAATEARAPGAWAPLQRGAGARHLQSGPGSPQLEQKARVQRGRPSTARSKRVQTALCARRSQAKG